MLRAQLIAIALGGVAAAAPSPTQLEPAMAGAGFHRLATEWWHFDAPDSTNHALSDEPL